MQGQHDKDCVIIDVPWHIAGAYKCQRHKERETSIKAV